MAEVRQLDRVQPIGRAAVTNAGVKPFRTPARVRHFFLSFNPWLWGIVGQPTLIAGVYYFGIASDLYLSEAQFIVRSPKQVQTSTIGTLLQSTGLGRAEDDTAAVQDFIMSRGVVRKLERQNDLRAVFNRPEGDLVSRFPGIPFWRKDFDALFGRYDHFVTVETDTSTEVT
jgi:capsular polysaccharide transport system permease protein